MNYVHLNNNIILFRIETEDQFRTTLDKIPDYDIQEEDVSIYQILLQYQLWVLI